MYRLVWIQSALNELANAWIAADSNLRKRITAAANELDQRLRVSPKEQGESRIDNERIAFELPLGIFYEVDEDEAVVNVVHV